MSFKGQENIIKSRHVFVLAISHRRASQKRPKKEFDLSERSSVACPHGVRVLKLPVVSRSTPQGGINAGEPRNAGPAALAASERLPFLSTFMPLGDYAYLQGASLLVRFSRIGKLSACLSANRHPV